MTFAAGAPLAQEDARDLFDRLLAGDPVAPAQLAEHYLAPLENWLMRHNRSVRSDLCAEAAEDAIIALIKNPASYRPDCLSLWSYLRMSAKGDLVNALAKQARRAGAPDGGRVVELSAVCGNLVMDRESDPALIVERQQEIADAVERVGQVPGQLKDGLTDVEAEVLRMMLEKVRPTAAYARVLGIEHLPLAEQRRRVKREKDRLGKRLERARPDHV